MEQMSVQTVLLSGGTILSAGPFHFAFSPELGDSRSMAAMLADGVGVETTKPVDLEETT